MELSSFLFTQSLHFVPALRRENQYMIRALITQISIRQKTEVEIVFILDSDGAYVQTLWLQSQPIRWYAWFNVMYSDEYLYSKIIFFILNINIQLSRFKMFTNLVPFGAANHSERTGGSCSVIYILIIDTGKEIQFKKYRNSRLVLLSIKEKLLHHNHEKSCS